MGFCRFCILFFAISLASSAFANIQPHHFGFGNSFYGFCDFAQNDSNRSSPDKRSAIREPVPDAKHHKTEETDPAGNSFVHTYDANGNRRTTTAPGVTGNQVTTYTHDVNNNLTNLQSGAANISWQYDRSGRVTKTTLGGLTTDQTWDGAARLASRTHRTASGTQQSFAYSYDKNGNRTSETRNLGTGVESITYSYDADDRLTNVTHSDGRSETYTLDANGNRRTITRSGYLSDNGVTTNTFDARGRIGQKQTPSGTVSYTWDAAGNLTQVQSGGLTITYTWNAENQLIGIQQNGSQLANYRYTNGLRDQVQSAGDTTRTVWSDGFAFLKQDHSGQTLTRTEHAGIKALYLTSAYGNEVLLRDGLDSVTGSFANGALQSRTDYSAWGEATQTGSTQSNHGYTGHLQDDTGLIYARARYYDPSIGRFISRDPLEGLLDSPITWNAYVYGNANPFYYVDPTGEAAHLTWLEEVSKESAGVWTIRREAAAAEGATLRALGTGFAEGLAHIGYGGAWLMNAASDLIIRNNNLPGAEEAAQAMLAKEMAMADLMGNVRDVAEIVRQDPAGAAKQVGTGLVDFGHGVVTGDAQAWGTVGQIASGCALMPSGCVRGVAAAGRGIENVAHKTGAILTEQANKLGMAGRAVSTTRTVETISGVNLRVINNTPSSPSNFVKNSPGVTVQRAGNYWIKEVDQGANAVARWYGKRSIEAQARGLDRLGDMGTTFLYREGKIITRDAGAYTPRQFWSTWTEGSRRLGTPFNDIRPRNIGANGIIYDPSKIPLQQGLEAIAYPGIVGGVGFMGYQYWRAP